MPLSKAATKAARSKNIATLIREGRSPKQAAAIAFSVQRKAARRDPSRSAPKRARKKRALSPAQLAALAKGRAAMAAKRGRKSPRTPRRKSALTPSVKRDTVRHMAKRRRSRRSSAIVHHRRAPASRARKAARVVGGIASENKHMTGAVIGAAALGFAKKQGYEIPHIKTVGEAGSLALAGYALEKFGIYKARWLRHAVTGFACIAAYEMASTGDIPILSPKQKTSGDEMDGAYDAR